MQNNLTVYPLSSALPTLPQVKRVILSASEISHDLSDKAYTSALFRWDSSLPFRMTENKKIRHIERKRNIPPSKYGICTLQKTTLPGDCFATLAKTVKQTALPPSGEVARNADRGSHVILSVSEISHDFSEKYMHRQFIGGILHYRSE